MSIVLRNNSSHKDKHGETDWWNWTAYIEATEPDSLDDVDYVEYHLHPQFKNPVQRVWTMKGGFPLSTSGWGTFELRARVVFKEERRKPSMVLSHYLEFEGAK